MAGTVNEDRSVRLSSSRVALLFALSIVGASPQPGEAQLGSLRRQAEEARKKLEEATKKNSADSAAKAKSTADSATKTKAAADTARSAPSSATPSASTTTVSAPAKSDPKVWENYDFVPGNKIIFYTDFSDDRVGNFARGLKYRSGPAEVIERDGVKMLRTTGRAEMLIPVGKQLPERFTLEIDVIGPASGVHEMVAFEGGAVLDRGDKSANVYWSPRGTWIQGSGMNGGNSTINFPEPLVHDIIGNLAHIRVLMDSGYFKMYVNERRIYNRPDLAFRRDSVIRLLLGGLETDGMATYVTSIRVAESETDVLYDALLAKGRWATHGILFATGKADLQPESGAVLKEIAATLRKYPELKVLIEGHTDNVGSAASNLTLSDARAAAVKTALVANYGIEAVRLTAKGFGDTKPSVPNASSAGRAQNRRVEFVKQ